ncbi:MAG TPA: hypothetical protein VNF68_01360 [Candidatus Baltobacteraceae bacterium]|nr:hypothetical protein [Candidatus Baltobacteraceae bacterium]
MKRYALLLPLLTFVGCSSSTALTSTIGSLPPGATMTVVSAHAAINVYKPAIGEPPDRFTVATMVKGQAPDVVTPKIRRSGRGVIVDIPDPGIDGYGVLIRVPDRVNLVIDSKQGNVNVTDINGNVDVKAGTGNVKIMVPGFARASVVTGNLDVTMGTATWPGTLRFSAGTGDVNVYVPEIAKFHARMHTDDGMLFTDFPLRGTAHGRSETIDANVNGGSPFGVDIESHAGTVRLLQLSPQA